MGKSRRISTKVWEDNQVSEKYTTEDKIFWLYLLTNDRVNNLGCYKLTRQKISVDLGYTQSIVENLLTRFINYHQNINYDFDTNEILIKNFHRYNWTSSPTFKKGLENELEKLDSKKLKSLMIEVLEDYYGKPSLEKEKPKNKTQSKGKKVYKRKDEIIPFLDNELEYEIIEDQDLEDDKTFIKIVIDSFNRITGARFTYNNKTNNSYILGRKNEGHTIEEFIKVIDYKYHEWKDNKKMAKYIRPMTLFSSTNFPNYLVEIEMNKNVGGNDDEKLWEMINQRRNR